MSVSHVALGPNDSWVIQYKNGELSWSSGLPKESYNFLNRQNDGPLAAFAMGDQDDYFAVCENGDYCYDWSGPKLYANQIECVTLGENGSYIIISERGLDWRGVPFRADELLRTKNNSALEWATLGFNGSYVLMYQDGAIYWNDKSLDQIIKGQKQIQRIYLCPSSENYFVLFANGDSCWSVSESFSNAILSDKRMSPRDIAYLNSSIKREFKDGRSIYDTMNDLKHGDIDPDDIPAITVIEYRGITYSVDNRRLWAFKQSGVRDIPVIVKEADASFFSQLNNNNRRLHDIYIR